MGGSIGVTLREENGKEHRMCRWTNPLPWFVNNIRLLNKDPAHIKEYLKTWYDMREDYEKHKDEWEAIKKKYREDAHNHDPFEKNMTSCYAPYPFLAPQEYGLVVVDMLNNHILSYQRYTGLGYISDILILENMQEFDSELFNIDNLVFKSKDDEYSAVRFRELFEAGKISGVLEYDYENKKFKKVDIKGKSLDEAIEWMQERDGEGHLKCGREFEIDMSPYTLIKYKKHNPKEAAKMKEKIHELGFVLSDEEKRLWDEWIGEHRLF